MRKFWLGVLICTFIGIAYFLYLFYSEEAYLPSLLQNLPHLFVSIFTANLIGLVMYTSDRQLNKYISWKENLSTRFISGLLVNILLATGIMAVISWIYLGIYIDNFRIGEIWTAFNEYIIKLSIITLIAIVLYSLIYFALYSYNQYAIVQIESIKDQRKQLQLQFDVLKSQLSPHYLFNSLNTISSLIFKDAYLAEDFIRRLALTYQYILDNNKKQFVTLEQEVEFVKSYNYLLKVRFQNNLHLEINLPKNIMHTPIPPLTLQMLVENAVKHNVINQQKPLYIYISAVDNTVINIINTKTDLPAHVSSFQVGLKNIKQRYSFFTDKPIKVMDASKFTVSLPVLKNVEL
ncbi:sensor histidine kinase [Fulvivirga ligni]|uniref:sensor histidine kinase n=1 Tax=Fulvivirga ligni TaxID=2904246 RepID=UPI001F1A7B97|nr:histidine kinase [Fulvivirga ligni]UII20679.1 histidine kinase [Fulvivirga ligni]